MNKQSKVRWLTLAAAAALVAVSAGCQNAQTAERLHGERFEEDDAPRSSRNVAAVQAANGARADATLYPAHFNSAGLNSLGRDKLDKMMLDDEATAPMTVYLDLGKDESAVKLARTAVAGYLKARGVSESGFKIEDGPNPRTRHSSEEAIAGLDALNKSSGANNQGGQPVGNATGYSGSSQAAPPSNPNH